MSEVTLHQCSIPKAESQYGDSTELGEYEIEDFQKQGVDEVWYWYVTYGYEASGQVLMRKDDKWAVHDMGHCSCYGPTDSLAPIEWFDSIDNIQGTNEWDDSVKTLIEKAKEPK